MRECKRKPNTIVALYGRYALVRLKNKVFSPKTVGGKAQYPEQMHLNKPLSAGGCGVPI
jgi:hypothetical protein